LHLVGQLLIQIIDARNHIHKINRGMGCLCKKWASAFYLVTLLLNKPWREEITWET